MFEMCRAGGGRGRGGASLPGPAAETPVSTLKYIYIIYITCIHIENIDGRLESFKSKIVRVKPIE
jgi:hypothetical protein